MTPVQWIVSGVAFSMLMSVGAYALAWLAWREWKYVRAEIDAPRPSDAVTEPIPLAIESGRHRARELTR